MTEIMEQAVQSMPNAEAASGRGAKSQRNVRRYAFFTSDEIDRMERVMRYEGVEEDMEITWTGMIRDMVIAKMIQGEKKYGLNDISRKDAKAQSEM